MSRIDKEELWKSRIVVNEVYSTDRGRTPVGRQVQHLAQFERLKFTFPQITVPDMAFNTLGASRQDPELIFTTVQVLTLPWVLNCLYGVAVLSPES